MGFLMAEKWSTIIESPEYNALDGEGQAKLKERYFQNVISKDPSFSGLDEVGQTEIRQRFFGGQRTINGQAVLDAPRPVEDVLSFTPTAPRPDPIERAAGATIREAARPEMYAPQQPPQKEPGLYDLGGDIEIGLARLLRSGLRIVPAAEMEFRTQTGQFKDFTPAKDGKLDTAHHLSEFSRGFERAGQQLQNIEDDLRGKQRPLSFDSFDEGTARIIRGVTQNSPNMAGAFAVSLLTGNPSAGPAMFFATTKADEQMRMVKEGVSPDKASLFSNLYGAWEGGTEMLVFPKLFKGATKGIPLRQLPGMIVENAGQEGLAAFLEGFTKEVEENTNANGTLKEGVDLKTLAQNAADRGLSQMPEDMAIGAVSALGPGAVGTAVETVQQQKAKEQSQDIENQYKEAVKPPEIAAPDVPVSDKVVAPDEMALRQASETAQDGLNNLRLREQGISPQEAEAMTEDELAYALMPEDQRSHMESISQEFSPEQSAEIDRVLAELDAQEKRTEDVREQMAQETEARVTPEQVEAAEKGLEELEKPAKIQDMTDKEASRDIAPQDNASGKGEGFSIIVNDPRQAMPVEKIWRSLKQRYTDKTISQEEFSRKLAEIFGETFLSKADRKKILSEVGVDPGGGTGQLFTTKWKSLYGQHKKSLEQNATSQEDIDNERIREAWAAADLSAEQRIEQDIREVYNPNTDKINDVRVSDIIDVFGEEMRRIGIPLEGASSVSRSRYYGDELNRIRISDHTQANLASGAKIFVGIGENTLDADIIIPESASTKDIKVAAQQAAYLYNPDSFNQSAPAESGGPASTPQVEEGNMGEEPINIPPVAKELMRSGPEAAKELRKQVSDVRYGPPGTILFEFQGETYEVPEPDDVMPAQDNKGTNNEAARSWALKQVLSKKASLTKKASSKKRQSGKLDYEGLVEGAQKAKKNTLRFTERAKQLTDDALVPISHRLENMDPALFRSVRDHAFDVQYNTKQTMDKVEPWLKHFDSLPQKIRNQIQDYLYSGEIQRAENLIDRTGGLEVFRNAMNTMDALFVLARENGVKMEAMIGWYPRAIKDMRGFMEYVEDEKTRSGIKDALKERAKRTNRTVNDLTDREVWDVINSQYRGFPTGKVLLARPGHAKERSVNYGPELREFYHDPSQSMVQYIMQMERAIADNQFFNKVAPEISQLKAADTRARSRLAGLQKSGQDTRKAALRVAETEKALSEAMEALDADRPKSIGQIVQGLRDQHKLNYKQEQELQRILQGYFSTKKGDATLNGLMNLTYGLTLGNSLLHNITQIPEIALGLMSGKIDSFVPAMAGSLTSKTWQDMGGKVYSQELREFDVSKIVDRLLQVTMWTDNLGKNTLADTAINDAFKNAQKPTKPFLDKLKLYFGDEYTSVLQDMKDKRVTRGVKQYAFNVVSDFQPTSRAEMPALYLSHPGWKVAYALKMFTIKRSNAAIQQAIRDFKNGRPLRGVTRMASMIAILSALGIGAKALKDFARGKPLEDDDWPDRVWDEFLRWALYSRYQMEQAGWKGPVKSFAEGLGPALPLIDVADAAISGDPDKLKDLTKYTPVLGDLYYWWFQEEEPKKRRKRR
jgi:hypothetical protein